LKIFWFIVSGVIVFLILKILYFPIIFRITKLNVYILQLGINCYLKDVVKLAITFFNFCIIQERGTNYYLRGGIWLLQVEILG